jgi:hypothetical protein
LRLAGVRAVKLPLLLAVALRFVQVIDQVTVTFWCGRAVACARMIFGWRIARLTVQAAAAPEAWHEPVLWV